MYELNRPGPEDQQEFAPALPRAVDLLAEDRAQRHSDVAQGSALDRAVDRLLEQARSGNAESITALLRMSMDDSQPQPFRQSIHQHLERLAYSNDDRRATVINAYVSSINARRIPATDVETATTLVRIASEQPPGTISTIEQCLSNLRGFAGQGTNRADQVLAMFAAGLGDRSPLSTTVQTAADVLQRVAEHPDRPENRQRIVDTLTNTFNQVGDGGRLLACLGRLVAGSAAPNAAARSAIENAYEALSRHRRPMDSLSLHRFGNPTVSSAIDGFLAINPPSQWNQESINRLLQSPSREFARAIAARVLPEAPADQRIPEPVARQVLMRSIEELGQTNDMRRALAFGDLVEALLPVINPQDFTRLSAFPANDGNRLALTHVAQHAARGANAQVRLAATDYLTTNGWSPIAHESVTSGLRASLTRDTLSLSQQDAIFASARNLGAPMPVAVQLRRMLPGSDHSDAQVQQTADRMVQRHGAGRAAELLASVAAFNAASPTLRGQLSSADNHSGTIDVAGFARSLADCDLPSRHQFLRQLPQQLVSLQESAIRERNEGISETQRLSARRQQAMEGALAAGHTPTADEEAAHYRPGDALPAGWSNPTVGELAVRQGTRATAVATLDAQLRQQELRLRSTLTNLNDVNVALAAYDMHTLTVAGRADEAQRLATRVLAERQISITPELESAISHTGLWRSLNAEGHRFALSTRDLPVGEGAFNASMRALRDFSPARSGERSLMNSGERAAELDSAALQTVQNRIMSEPAIARLIASAERMGRMTDLAQSFQRLITGHTRTAEMAALMRLQATELRQVLEGVRPEDIQSVRQMAGEFERRANDSTAPQAVRDFARQLQQNLSGLAEVLDPRSEANRQMQLACRGIESGQLDEPSFRQQLLSGALHVVAAVGTAAFVTATCGTGLPVVLAAVPLACAATREIVETGLQAAGTLGLPGVHRGGIISSWATGNVVVDENTGRLRYQNGGEMASELLWSTLRDGAVNAATLGVGVVGARIGTRAGEAAAASGYAGPIGNLMRPATMGETSGLFNQFLRQVGPALALDGASRLALQQLGGGEIALGMGFEFVRSMLSHARAPQAARQSQQYARGHELRGTIHDGTVIGGVGNSVAPEAVANRGSISGLMVDRTLDPHLQQTVSRARNHMRQFESLPTEQQLARLAQFVQQQFTPAAGVDAATQQSLYLQLANTASGRPMLLGEFLQHRIGCCREQAALFQVLSNELLPGAQVSMVRGQGIAGDAAINHAWNTATVNGRTYIIDTARPVIRGGNSQFVLSASDVRANNLTYRPGAELPAAAQNGAAPRAITAGANLDYLGSPGWRVQAVSADGRYATIQHDAALVVGRDRLSNTSAAVGQSVSVQLPDGSHQPGWTVQGVDGNRVILSRRGGIELTLPTERLTRMVPEMALQNGARHRLRNPNEETLRQWFEHEAANIQLDGDERAALQAAQQAGLFEYRVMDNQYLRSSALRSREAGRRPGGAYDQMGLADNYDPMHPENRPVFVVRDDRTGVLHVINGNNRVYLFGDRSTNPNNLGLPVWYFHTPAAFEQVLGVRFDGHHQYEFNWRD